MNKYKTLATLIIFIIALLLVSCPQPGKEIQSPSHTPELTPPEAVDARCADEGFYISWEPVEGADYYEIYRQIGWGDVVLIEARCYETYFIDYYKTYKQVRYFIKSCTDDDASDYSDPTDYISRYVLNVKASRFEYENKIELTWDKHASATAYNVYRYVYKSGENPLCFKHITSITFSDLYDEDNPESIEHNIPYYYKVTYVDDEDEEQGPDGPFVLGVFGASKDFYEPNDDYTLLSEAESGSVFFPDQPPIIYSYGDEAGGVDSDIDWYVYAGLPESFFVKVRLPEDTLFQDGELRLQFYYPRSGEVFPEQPIYTNGTTMLSFSNFGDVPMDEMVRVYFKIYPVLHVSKDISGPYYVEITDEL